MVSHNSAKFVPVKTCVFDKRRTVFYMKISSSQMFRNLSKWSLRALSVAVFAGAFSVSAQSPDDQAAIDGGKLFSAKCATCHQPFKDGTGPKLYGAKAKWEAESKVEGAIYNWINNWQSAAASDPYAAGIAKLKPTAMSMFPELTRPEIDAILGWVDSQVEVVPGSGDGGAGSAVGEVAEEGSGLGWVWIILGVVFVVIILAVSGVRRQLQTATGEAGEDADKLSYGESFRKWAWANFRYALIGGAAIAISLLVILFQNLYRIGVVEDYQPSQPIDFPHETHAGINGIDCKYCHNSVTKSKSAGLPTVNVCMNCHKQIEGNDDKQKAKIAKIYEAAGWDAEKDVYTGKTKPIVWNKVHVLPDHVYFNHSQHVVVGGVDCKQCHGDMTKMKETAKVQPVAALNEIEGNVKLTKPTLTMGWCIECHGEKEISTGNIDTKGGGYYAEIHKRLLNNDRKLYESYLEDGKVTVKELGGWECAKCHY